MKDFGGFQVLKSKDSRRKLQKMKDWEEQPVRGHGGLYQRNDKVRCHRDYKSKFVEKVRADLKEKKKWNSSNRHDSHRIKKHGRKSKYNESMSRKNSAHVKQARKELDSLLFGMEEIKEAISQIYLKKVPGKVDQQQRLYKLEAMHEINRMAKSISMTTEKCFDQMFYNNIARSNEERQREKVQSEVRKELKNRVDNFKPYSVRNHHQQSYRNSKKNVDWNDEWWAANITNELRNHRASNHGSNKYRKKNRKDPTPFLNSDEDILTQKASNIKKDEMDIEFYVKQMENLAKEYMTINIYDNRKRSAAGFEMANLMSEVHDAEITQSSGWGLTTQPTTGANTNNAQVTNDDSTIEEDNNENESNEEANNMNLEGQGGSSDLSDQNPSFGQATGHSEMFGSATKNEPPFFELGLSPSNVKAGKDPQRRKSLTYDEIRRLAESSHSNTYISFNPHEYPLRSSGLLPPFGTVDDIKKHFDPFMNQLYYYSMNAKKPDYDFSYARNMHDYITEICSRTKRRHPEFDTYLESLYENTRTLFNTMIKVRNQAHEVYTKKQELRTEEYMHDLSGAMNELSVDELNAKLLVELAEKDRLLQESAKKKIKKSAETISSKPVESGGDDDGDDSSSSDESDSSSRSYGSRRSRKKLRSRPTSKSKKRDDEEEDDEDLSKLDKNYREILKELTKCAKNYKVKDLTMNPDANLRRERFNNWVIDVQNILSTHHRTAGLLDDYPASLSTFDNDVDRAIKAFLSSITSGMAKRIVGKASSAHIALLDLKRNYNQTSKFDIHREQTKMMNLKQTYGESASDFLRRIRKQMDTCDSVGCDLFSGSSGEELVTNIALQGLNCNIRAYSATLADLKSQFRRNPGAVTLIDLEEILFNVDDNLQSYISVKKERANYIHNSKSKSTNSSRSTDSRKCFHCGETGHIKRNCPKLRNKISGRNHNDKKKDMSDVTCFKCGGKGHYANKCPHKTNDKTVTIESAHVAKANGEEFGKACSEICFYTATLSDYTANYDEIGDLKNWLLDSGATSHFTPTFEDLLEPFLLDPPLYIRVADGSRLKATYEGAVEIRFKSDQGTYINLRLLRVLYVKGLQTRLFSIESFISDGRTSTTYNNGTAKLQFGNNLSKTIPLPHIPPSIYSAEDNNQDIYFAQEESVNLDDIENEIPDLMQQENNDDNVSDDGSLPALLDRFDDDSSDDESEAESNFHGTRSDPEDLDRDVLCLPCCTLKCCPDNESDEEDTITSLTEINASLHQTSISNNNDLQQGETIEESVMLVQIPETIHVGIFENDENRNSVDEMNRYTNNGISQGEERRIETNNSSDNSTIMYEAYGNVHDIESTTSNDDSTSSNNDSTSSYNAYDNEFNDDYHWTERQSQLQPPCSSSNEERATMVLELTTERAFNADPIDGGINNENWNPTRWTENQLAPRNRQRMQAELAHRIFGHRAILSLVKASKAEIWDDIKIVMDVDTWCGDCEIASIKRHTTSKLPSRMVGAPLQHMFMDCIPSPGILRGVKGYDAKDYLLLCDPVSKFVDKINLIDKSTASVIKALESWRGDMLRKGFVLFLYLRSDAGTNFTSNEFKEWCRTENIKLTVAGPKHQEQNGFVETSYKTIGKMARSMLVAAKMPLPFMHLALDYATIILRVMPHRSLKSIDGKPITTYEVLHKKKPRIRRFKVFGSPVIFKRYKPQHDGDTTTDFRQLQRGSRGIFVGFPRNQAGWLIYVPEKIGGHRLIVSMDVVFDQNFLTCPVGTDVPFAGGQPERHIGNVGGRQGLVTENTGDITNITDSTISHWGQNTTYESSHEVQQPSEAGSLQDRLGERSDDSIASSPESLNEDGENTPPDDTTNTPSSSDLGTVIDGGVRRSNRSRTNPNRLTVSNTQGQTYGDGSIQSAFVLAMKEEFIGMAMADIAVAFEQINIASDLHDVPITPYLPEPKNFRDISRLPDKIQQDWVKAIKKEIKFLIENETFNHEETPKDGDEIIPAMFIYKAKVTSRGYLDKLKARCVARGDLQIKSNDPDELWSPCVFARTFKMFVANAVSQGAKIKQLDYIGAFCQGFMQKRLFIQLPQEYSELMSEYADYFKKPQLIRKSLYGTDIAAKVWNHDLTEWMTTNKMIPFEQSTVDASLFVHRAKDGGFVYMIIYVDDSLYFGSSEDLEKKFESELGKRFKVDLLGWSHWFLGTRLYREDDGSYLLDQENYIKHILNRYCGKEMDWGLPRMQSTPAPVDYVYSKDNRPTSEDKLEIQKRFNGLSMPSAVSSLLYAALNTRCDILWITNKLAKSSTNPGIKDYEALLHVFGYLRKYPDYAVKFHADISKSSVHKICINNNIEVTKLIGFSDASWQDCVDTGRSTTGYKIFMQGGLIDAQSTLPVPVALSSAEAEYMGACGVGAMICHLRDLQYDFEYLGTSEYKVDGEITDIPSILLIDNQATVRMSKNYKMTKKNRHIRRRWHFVRYGVNEKLFELKWIKGDDQLADDCTKTQPSHKSFVHFERTLIKVPDKVKGYKSTTVGNR